MNLKTFAVLCTILIGASCVSNPRRPDSPMCGAGGDCNDSRGAFNEDPRLLLCTTPLGYSRLEDYVDKLELRVRQLERQCKKQN